MHPKHTPTPWYCVDYKSNGKESVRIHGAEWIATLDSHSAELDRVNGHLIVRAVNAHDALVSALEVMLANADASSFDGTAPGYEKARAALKLAEGR